jgi:putative nucleotidyltransferase with HDIG domain
MADDGPSGSGFLEQGRARLKRQVAALRRSLAGHVQQIYGMKWLWSLLFLAVLAPLVVGPRIGPALPLPRPGSVAADDIVAPAGREFEDDQATEELRQAAREAVPPVLQLDTLALARAQETVDRLFAEAARLGLAGEIPDRAAGASPMERARQFVESSGIDAPQASISHLLEKRFDDAIRNRLQAALAEIYRHRVIGSRTLLPRSGRVIVQDPRSGREWQEEPPNASASLEEARASAIGHLREAGATAAEAAALAPLLSDLITPNLTFNDALTGAMREQAAARVDPLIVRVPKGKVLVRRGETVSEDMIRTLAAYNRARDVLASGTVILGNLLLLSLLLFFMSRYVFFYQKSSARERHLFALMVVVMILGLTVDRGFQWLFDNLVDSFRVEPYANPGFYRFMVPMAAGAMLVTLLVNPRVGMAYALFNVPLVGMLMEWQLPLLLFCLLSNLAGIYGITAYRQRTALIRAGVLLGGVNAVAVLALQSVMGPESPASHLAFQMFCGFAGGILVAVMTSFLLPLLEWSFNILTDVRLLELSNLNNPLLRRLAVEAPGSYNHSVIVGTLAESAAEAIGANALFCRVAAYYHDVGKMVKPAYYVENQSEGTNRHDRLTPHMSALIIASHVKEGVELARSYGLPQQVVDIIPQHHGTRRINFFYEKARKTGDPAVEEVRDTDFRYPGPKPQSREAAIFMMSDSIEAAARTLEDPSPPRFKGLIQRIVSDIVLDDQLSDCNLTFSDLEKAKAAFLKTLCSIYHHRVDYPGFEFEKVSERPFRSSRTHDEQPPRTRRWGQ